MCKVIPDGVVAFFPSYDFLKQVLEIWKAFSSNATGPYVYDSISRVKPVLHEAQDQSLNTEDLLHQYADFIDQGKGALLLSVMGGKLSEGINFSDRLGRGVIVVGLPFANLRSAVLQAKMQHVEQRAYEKASGKEAEKKDKAKAASREFYENSCMRVVNQCIGRAIRHQNDYAAILMLDRRYGTSRIQSKLPSWIRQSLVSASCGSTINDLRIFFQDKNRTDVTNEN